MIRHTLILIGVVVLLALPAPAEPAEARRPMAELQTLLDEAEPGATVIVPPGTYEGNLRVRRAVTLDGRGRVVLDGLGEGTVVEIVAADVTVRGLTVRGGGGSVVSEPAGIRAVNGPVVIEGSVVEDALFGIDLRESPDSVIRGNTVVGKDLDPGRRGDGIRLWWSHGCTIEGNCVRDSRDMVFWYSEDLRVTDNTVTGSRYGLHFMYSHDTVLRGNDLSANSVGVYLMYSNSITLTDNRMTNNRGASGYGIGLKDCDDIVITGNALLANRVGAYIDNSPSSFNSTGLFEANMIAFNEIGLLATPNTHDNVFTGNAFIENEEQAATHGRGDLNLNTFARDGAGNFWSDYAGFDRDADGVGDLAYEPRSLFGQMLAREPNLRLFVHSPAQQAVEFTARALPELRPEPTLVDPAPLARPPVIEMAQAAAALENVGLTGHERKRVRDLSGGMKQRLALAIATLADPPLIVLDEPTSNLDAAGRGEVVETLRRLKERGKTLLFASHRPDEVITLADRVLVLERGRVERETTPLELWPTEKPVQVVRLFLNLASEVDAARVLRDAGHAVHLNGQGLCVAVPRDRKAEPIHTLARSRIEVRDLEVLDDVRIPEAQS